MACIRRYGLWQKWTQIGFCVFTQKVSTPNELTHIYWSGVWNSKQTVEIHVFERDWTTSSKILNKSRLSSERVWGGMRRNMSSFSMKEDIHFNVKWDIGVESHKLWWGNDNKLDMNWLSVLHEGSQSIPDQSSNIAYMQFMYDQRIFSLCRGSNLRSTSK